MCFTSLVSTFGCFETNFIGPVPIIVLVRSPPPSMNFFETIDAVGIASAARNAALTCFNVIRTVCGSTTSVLSYDDRISGRM